MNFPCRSSLLPSFVAALAIVALARPAAASDADSDETIQRAPAMAVVQDLREIEATPQGVRFAPTLSLGFPQPLALGVETYWNTALRFYLQGGYFGLTLDRSAGRALTIYSLESGARWRPFGNFFFAQLGLGYRAVSFDASIASFQLEDESIQPATNLKFQTFYGNVCVGGRVRLGERWYWNFDAGVQLPIMANGKMVMRDTSGSTPDGDEALQGPYSC
jgi:hypothetical protein